MKHIKSVAFGFVISLAMTSVLSTPASAYTECSGTISRIYRGDTDNKTWVEMNGGGAAWIYNTDPNLQAYLSMLITAKAANMQVTFRYIADNATCSALHTDVQGLWLG